jgi:uncharacterized protein
MQMAASICEPCKRMLLTLSATEVRVLGSLIEKEATTPENYPLSLNALLNACNQKSNREPVVEYDEDTILAALESLRAKRLSFVIEGSRVTKYRQRISETLNLGRRELAVLAVLFLRGPQTLGEIRDRCERLYSFADLDETELVLRKLSDWPEGAMVTVLPRQSGQKEARYAHLLSGEPQMPAAAEVNSAPAPSRVAQLELRVDQLAATVEEMRRRLDDLIAKLT